MRTNALSPVKYQLPLFDWAERHRYAPPRIISWRVNRWLGVDRVEVR